MIASARAVLAEGLAVLGLDPASAIALEQLADLLERWAARLNLTAHRGAEAIARRLILDALALGQALPGAPPLSIVDLGSGAGFPSLPLAIVWPSCAVSLVEARERRHHFQRTAIREIGIANAMPLLGRAEGLDPEPHAVVVAQAMAEPAVALGWMRRWVGPAGWLAIPRSAGADTFEPPPGVFHVETRAYRVPCGGPDRELWLGRLESEV